MADDLRLILEIGKKRTVTAGAMDWRAYITDGRTAQTWPIRFLVPRSAQQVMDHASEMEDRDLTGH